MDVPSDPGVSRATGAPGVAAAGSAFEPEEPDGSAGAGALSFGPEGPVGVGSASELSLLESELELERDEPDEEEVSELLLVSLPSAGAEGVAGTGVEPSSGLLADPGVPRAAPERGRRRLLRE